MKSIFKVDTIENNHSLIFLYQSFTFMPFSFLASRMSTETYYFFTRWWQYFLTMALKNRIITSIKTIIAIIELTIKKGAWPSSKYLFEFVRTLTIQNNEDARGAYAIISIILKLASLAESFEVTIKNANYERMSEMMLANWVPKSDLSYSRTILMNRRMKIGRTNSIKGRSICFSKEMINFVSS